MLFVLQTAKQFLILLYDCYKHSTADGVVPEDVHSLFVLLLFWRRLCMEAPGDACLSWWHGHIRLGSAPSTAYQEYQ